MISESNQIATRAIGFKKHCVNLGTLDIATMYLQNKKQCNIIIDTQYMLHLIDNKKLILDTSIMSLIITLHIYNYIYIHWIFPKHCNSGS